MQKINLIHSFILEMQQISEFRDQSDREKDGESNGRTDRPYFIGPFPFPPGIQKTGYKLTKVVSNVMYFEIILCCET